LSRYLNVKVKNVLKFKKKLQRRALILFVKFYIKIMEQREYETQIFMNFGALKIT